MFTLIVNDDGEEYMKIEDEISWSAEDLIRWGFVKNYDHWEQFMKHMNDASMQFFEGDEVTNEFDDDIN